MFNMKMNIITIIILLLFISVYMMSFPKIDNVRKPVSNIQARGMILPPLVNKALSLEYRSVIAEFLFLRASQYYGEKIASKERLTMSDMWWLYRNLIVITELDPYFEDPYYYGNALLTWETGMYNEANTLLRKAINTRTWDWQLPFFLGFNTFYFLKDNKAGADYLLIAAKRPGAPKFLPTLAARLYYQAQNTEIALSFLKDFYESEKNEVIRNLYAVRINALEKILMVEKAVTEYRRKTKQLPSSLDILVHSGLLKQIPRDPYGGQFYLDKDGSVKTTSKLAFQLRAEPSQKSE